jgi:nucleoid-associated protein
MKIKNVIIHEIKKTAQQTGAKIVISNTCMDATGEVIIGLIENLNERYKNKSETYGVFDATNETRFHEEFKDYHAKPTEAAFIKFTKKTAGDLKDIITNIAPAKGGFLVFARYTSYKDFIGIFLVRDTDGLLFKRNSAIKNFSIKKAQHIDFEKMAMACRINMQAFKDDEQRYLSFINKKSDSLSQYFSNWISATDNESDETDTHYLYKLLKSVDPPLDADGKVQTKEALLEKVYKHIYAADRRVNVQELSKMFYNDENLLTNYANSNDLRITAEFKAHKTVLRKFVQIRARANNIEIIFSKDLYNTTVRIPKDNPNQIIIDSAELANKIRGEVGND